MCVRRCIQSRYDRMCECECAVRAHVCVCVCVCVCVFVLPWPKKRTIIEIRGEKNAVPRVISCSIRRDQRRASPIRDCPRLLPCADRAQSSMISHVEQRSSRRESR